MKRITLTLAIIFCCCLTNTGFAQIMEDDSDSEQWVSFYDDVHKGRFKPFEFPPVRKADIVEQRKIWRTIDFREKQNQVFYYPIEPIYGRVNLYYALNKAVEDGLIRVYKTDDCLEESNWEELKNSLATVRTITNNYYDSIDEMDKDTNIEVRTEIKAEDIKKLRVREDWFIDKQRSVRDCRLFSFALVLDQGERGELAIFWVRYDEPEVRQLLANTEVFNPQNDAMRMSYDDMFISRRFASYVIQESTTQARKISDYLTGEDALLESDKIENDLFLMDEDLWEY
jgi:gliding motility associated protien GldN